MWVNPSYIFRQLLFILAKANTCFRKREKRVITYKSGVTCSKIDFLLGNQSKRKILLDRKDIPDESLTTQQSIEYGCKG